MNYPEVKGRGSIEWAKACKSVDEKTKETCIKLKSQGISAFHPDDGWYEPEIGKLRLQYPYYREYKLKIGDKVAVGDYDFIQKIHEITGVDENDQSVVYFKPIEKKCTKDDFDKFILFLSLALLLIYLLTKITN